MVGYLFYCFRFKIIRLEIWQGFVFINMDDNAVSLEEYLAPIPEHHKRWDLGNCKKVIHVSKVVPGNWKTVQEAFMESFHATLIHPEILPFQADENAMREVVGNSEIQPILTGARQKTEEGVRGLMQETLDSYGAGIQIREVKMQKLSKN